MLAARALTTRQVQRITRNFATVVDSAGVKVASVENNQPTSAITLLVRAGSRFEQKQGVAHALKNFAFKSTAKRTALGTVRESDLYGGVLSAHLTREHLALTAEFMQGDEAFYFDVLSSFATSAKFSRHEFEEFVSPLMLSEVEAAKDDPSIRAIEAAHLLAFRSGLGASLFAPEHNTLTNEDVRSFASSAFLKGNFAILGTGISQATLSKLVENSFSSVASGSVSSPASSYFGGETRLEHSGPQTVFIGYGVQGAPSPHHTVLAAHLSTSPAIKWSQGLSRISRGIPRNVSVQTVFMPYSDATLFGLLIQGSTAEGVREAGKVAVAALKAASQSISEEELRKAVAKAKFAIAHTCESRDGLFSILGSRVWGGGPASIDAAISPIDRIGSASFSSTTSTLIGAKPTFVAVGDIHALPYPDELGL